MADDVRIKWDGDDLVVPAGITVAAAGFVAGRRVLQRSRSLREPRGYFCGIGRCFSCAMAIDGVGRSLACLRQVRDGMCIELLDGDPVPPTMASSRREAGVAPEALTIDVLVVGGGAAGRAALHAAADAGARALGVTAGIGARRGQGHHEGFRRGMVWGVFDQCREWAVGTDGDTLALHSSTAVIATGASEVGVAVRHGTRPGVMTATAMRRLLDQGVSPGARPYLYGEEPFLRLAAQECRRHGIKPAESATISTVRILDVLGGNGVVGIVTSEDEVKADALVFCTAPHPHLELLQAAGADLYWDEVIGGHVPAFDRSLQTSIPGLFLAGGVAGAYTAEHAALHGSIAGRAAALVAAGAAPPAADWLPVMEAARALGVDPVEPRAWAARSGVRRVAANQWLRDQG